jgi:hypothetical protein
MKMYRIYIILLLTHCVSATEVRLNVVDENGEPIEGATVVVGLASYMNLKSKELTGLTNETGNFSVRGNPNHSIYYRVWKSGFYAAEEKRLAADRDHDLAIVLPQIRNPRPLYYYRINPKVPGLDKWYGFDLKMGDWVAPNGVGKITDFNARLSRKFIKITVLDRDMVKIRDRNPNYTEEDFKRIWGLWDMNFEIHFSDEKSGVTESKQFFEYSKMPLPYLAPLGEYKPILGFEKNSREWANRRTNVGYFLRSRVVLDDVNNIIAANYSKLLGEPVTDAEGNFKLEYYFNPDVNDLNLEYDGSNLAGTDQQKRTPN